MKQFIDAISPGSGVGAARSAFVGATAAILLIGCASTPDDAGRNSATRTAQLRPRVHTVAQTHKVKAATLGTCFEQAQGGGTTIGEQRVEMEVQLPASGTPRKVRIVNDDVVDPTVKRCLEEAIGGFDYGKAKRGATFYQVFIFDDESGEIAFEKPVNAYQRWGLTRREIGDVFAAHEAEINQCYALAPDSPTGRVVLNMSIRDAGPPEQVSLKSSTLKSNDADMCLVESALEMEFPEPRGEGITVREVPLHFSPDEGWRKPKKPRKPRGK